MSKLYKKYQELKKENQEKIYAFKSGIFYLFLDEDAKKLGPILGLKITNLNDKVIKCGFPVSTIQKYLTKFKTLPYEIELIEKIEDKPIGKKEFTSLKKYETLTCEISKIDLNTLSVSQAFMFLDKIQKQAKNILKEITNG